MARRASRRLCSVAPRWRHQLLCFAAPAFVLVQVYLGKIGPHRINIWLLDQNFSSDSRSTYAKSTGWLLDQRIGLDSEFSDLKKTIPIFASATGASPGATASTISSSKNTFSRSGLNFLFVTDCSEHQRWMAFNVFNSARAAGHDEPITWLRSGCTSDNLTRKHFQLANALYGQAKVADVRPEAIRSGQDFNLGMGIPKALALFLNTSAAPPDEDILIVIEADMIFLSRLRLDDLEGQGLLMKGRLVKKNEAGSFISSKVGIAAHYHCCNSLGPPYILSLRDWRTLIPFWSKAGDGKGWGADQVAFAEAAQRTRIHFNVFEHFMVCSPPTTPRGWELVLNSQKAQAGNTCASKKFGVQPGQGRLPNFLHVVQPWQQSSMDGTKWGFSKYQVPPGWKHKTKTDGILECGMPLFAEPPASLAQNGTFHGWVVCTILHSLNSMLLRYKGVACPRGYNSAKALKMKVPLEWTNELLDGAVEAAPYGTDVEWMKRCATQPSC